MISPVAPTVVVVDTMVVSSIVQASRNPSLAASYRALIRARPIVISFVTVAELRYVIFHNVPGLTVSARRA